MSLSTNSEFPNNIVLNTCMNCKKKECSLINDLNFDELSLLESNRYLVTFKPGEFIFKEGTKPVGLLALSEGKVKIIQKGKLGNELIIGLKKPVDFIGFKALMAEKTYVTSAIALEYTEICFIGKDDFFEVVKNNNNISRKIIKHFANELNQSQFRTINLVKKHLRGRMAEALLLVEDVYGISTQDGSLDVLLKRADFASLANMTTANSIRILSAFSKEHLIELDKRKITLLDKEALLKISNL